ncbi:MAG: aminoglycoside phosphotransferase family protein [Phenylobacterium sp.]|uniref:aminoglycoside phosphotransferase family protein n=1 Tax=Phenylobacterium sp. TaxID=1871053 RepID=UPI002733CA7F|nr:aminoglycoside phosphotransferase family protein [Phenylobacterium sp.]MDP3174767.1 aminoglycoside phosphotransferase family protein [Phenylobacterium sp.]
MSPTIDATLARRLVAAQFPQWAGLAIEPLADGGWDNRTFRLGATMSVRFPSHAAYEPQVAKEHAWLPRLAAHLPLPVPEPVAMGRPDEGYPWRWSVYRWLDGEPATTAQIADLPQFAADLGGFLSALQSIDVEGGPLAGAHNFHRGGPISTYDAGTRAAIDALGCAIDRQAVEAVWDAALRSTWSGPPVWVHGDVSAGNLLVKGGSLSAVIDFGCVGVGDPACDLVIAWTVFEGESRAAFRRSLDLDDGAWARARGWALWKALIVWAGAPGANPRDLGQSRRIVDDLLADYAAVTPSLRRP